MRLVVTPPRKSGHKSDPMGSPDASSSGVQLVEAAPHASSAAWRDSTERLVCRQESTTRRGMSIATRRPTLNATIVRVTRAVETRSRNPGVMPNTGPRRQRHRRRGLGREIFQRQPWRRCPCQADGNACSSGGHGGSAVSAMTATSDTRRRRGPARSILGRPQRATACLTAAIVDALPARAVADEAGGLAPPLHAALARSLPSCSCCRSAITRIDQPFHRRRIEGAATPAERSRASRPRHRAEFPASGDA